MFADAVNGFFEAVGGLFMIMNVIQLHNDKQVKGVCLVPCFFFTTWSVWGLYYYPYLGQWLSFWGGVLLSAANVVYLGQVFWYTRGKS